MEEQDLILNLHGEVPPSPKDEPDIAVANSTTVLSAEQSFLPTLINLHQRFPRLRIILEHCTTAAAIDAVLSCGPTVAGTITAHHLHLTVDSWAGNAFNFCKPVAKLPSDREALIRAATSGNPKFFLGSDSAPHPESAKISKKAAAGVFTQPYLMSYVTEIFDRAGKLDRLAGFTSQFGRKFYQLEENADKATIVLSRRTVIVKDKIGGTGGDGIVPFRAGEKLEWEVTWMI
jgi:dihydroorotase